MSGDFLTLHETASALGVSTRHVRRLVESGSLQQAARGLIDHTSVHRHLQSHTSGRTRAWAEHTAWGCVALLAGEDAPWLGSTQTSRLRRELREEADPLALLPRLRGRTRVHVFEAHRSAIARLRGTVASPDLELLGISAAQDHEVDGYLPAHELDDLARSLGLRRESRGSVVLRSTHFDFEVVRRLVSTKVVAALDAAMSADPRIHGIGHDALAHALGEFR